MKQTHVMRFKGFIKVRKVSGLLWLALKKFNRDNGFFLSSGITFNILINLIPFILLLLALVGTYLYNDQEVLDHIHAYLREMALHLIQRSWATSWTSSRTVRLWESWDCGFALVLHVGLQLLADCP